MSHPAGKSLSSQLTHAACTALLCAAALPSVTHAQSSGPDFGPNVYIMDPSMTSSQIEATLSSLANEAQFSTNRYAVLFKPGTYAIQSPIGYYESVAGLGLSQSGVVLNGFITPNFGTTSQYNPGTNLTDTFWRSLENMTVNPVTDSAQNAPANTLQWGVSQGAPLRRLQINGGLELTDSYCGNASGGFMADVQVTGNVNACSQQQWYTRNSNVGSYSDYVWNFVFSGVKGAPAQSFPSPPNTTLATTPVVREKPFLYIDSKGNYNVFAPGLKQNSSSTSWSTPTSPGRVIPIANFFIAQPGMTAATMNAALAAGKSLILTPGIYSLSAPLLINNADTVVLGLGYATLVPMGGTSAIQVADVSGVQIAGLIVDAGPTNSPTLVQLGPSTLPPGCAASHATDPSSLSDVYFRVGGATAGSATVSLQINSSDVIVDDVWAWRADHGNGVGWNANTAAHGVVVNGNNVTALGLAVEHYQQEQVLWNGNNGETIFFQSELPYDPPSQAAWMDGAANGYPSYAVAPTVTRHSAYGLGIYSYFNQGINILEDNAMTVPTNSGIKVVDAGTVWLNGSGQITHVINNTGGAVNSSYADQVRPVLQYP